MKFNLPALALCLSVSIFAFRMYATLIIVGLVAGTLSGSVGFGGGMVLLPVITYNIDVYLRHKVSAIPDDSVPPVVPCPYILLTPESE